MEKKIQIFGHVKLCLFVGSHKIVRLMIVSNLAMLGFVEVVGLMQSSLTQITQSVRVIGRFYTILTSGPVLLIEKGSSWKNGAVLSF
jgi:hypothetical protein